MGAMTFPDGAARPSMKSIVKSHVALNDDYESVPVGHVACNLRTCSFIPVPEDDDFRWRETFAVHVAAELAASGYGEIPTVLEPAVITQHEALDALPVESAIAADGRVWVKRRDGKWAGTDSEGVPGSLDGVYIIHWHSQVAVIAIGGIPT